MRKTHTAFTLVELSIVLVILGLLVGGVLSGQSLIKSAERRATLKQIDELTTAMNTFNDKYMGLPGDLVNGPSFWPIAGITPGNGNGLIEAGTGCSPTPVSDPDCPMFNGERSMFYMELGLAGLTTNYDGTGVLGKGYPAIKMHPSQGMFVSGAWTAQSTAGSNMGIENYTLGQIYLEMMVCNPSQINVGSGHNDCAIFTGEELWNIDTKIDDGQPLSGRMLGESYNTTCVSGTSYALNGGTTPVCNAMYQLR